MKKLIIGLLLSGCYDPGASTERETDAVPQSPTHATPRLVGSTALRSAGVAKDAPLSGVEVCALGAESDLCAWSADDGLYALGPFSPGSRSKVRYDKPGFLPMIVEYDIPEHSINANVFLLPVASIEASARSLGVTYDASVSAGVVLTVHTINYGGIVPLAGARAAALGDTRFVYAGAAHELDLTLDQTSESGWAIALGVTPGPHRLELSHTDPLAACGHLTADLGSLEDSIVVEVHPDALTVATVYCFR